MTLLPHFSCDAGCLRDRGKLTKQIEEDEGEAWDLIRNPLPARDEDLLFDHVRTDFGISETEYFSSRPAVEVPAFTRDELKYRVEGTQNGLGFFQRHNPIVRHTVLRKRATLEARDCCRGFLPIS